MTQKSDSAPVPQPPSRGQLSPQAENYADPTWLFERAITSLSSALTVLKTSSIDRANLRYAMLDSIVGLSSIRHLMALCPEAPAAAAASAVPQPLPPSPPPASPCAVLPPPPPAADQALAALASLPPRIRRGRRSFDEHYKQQVVQLVLQHHWSINQVCKRLNLTYSAVRRWVILHEIRQLQRHKAAQPSELGGGYVRTLEQQVEQLRANEDVLTKAMGLLVRKLGSTCPDQPGQ